MARHHTTTHNGSALQCLAKLSSVACSALSLSAHGEAFAARCPISARSCAKAQAAPAATWNAAAPAPAATWGAAAAEAAAPKSRRCGKGAPATKQRGRQQAGRTWRLLAPGAAAPEQRARPPRTWRCRFPCIAVRQGEAMRPWTSQGRMSAGRASVLGAIATRSAQVPARAAHAAQATRGAAHPAQTARV